MYIFVCICFIGKFTTVWHLWFFFFYICLAFNCSCPCGALVRINDPGGIRIFLVVAFGFMFFGALDVTVGTVMVFILVLVVEEIAAVATTGCGLAIMLGKEDWPCNVEGRLALCSCTVCIRTCRETERWGMRKT